MIASADTHPATAAQAERASTSPRQRLMTIRARLAISYGVVIAAVLAVVTVAVGTVHKRLGMARVDAELTRAMRSVSGVVASEINERLDLAIGAHEACDHREVADERRVAAETDRLVQRARFVADAIDDRLPPSLLVQPA